MEILTLPATVVLAQLLTPYEFGLASIPIFFGRLAARLSNAGLGQGLMQVKELRQEHVSTVFAANLALAAVAAVTLLVSAPFIANFYHAPLIAPLMWAVALDFAFSALSVVSQALLSRDMKYKEMATLSALDTGAVAIGSVVLAWFGFGVWSLVLGNICGSLVRWLGGVRLVGWQGSTRFVPAAARELVSFSLGSYARTLLNFASQNLDNLVIGKVVGVTELGYYDKAFSFVQRVYNKVVVSGPNVSFRALVILQDEEERFRRALEKIVVTATVFTYASLALLGAMGPHLFMFLFGTRWLPSVIPFQLLCASAALKSAIAFSQSAVVAKGLIWSSVWRQVGQLIIMVVGIYLAAPFGVSGAAVAVLVAVLFSFWVTQLMLHEVTGLSHRELLMQHVPGAVITTVVVALVWGTDLGFRSIGVRSDFAILAVQGFCGGLATLAFIRWCPFPVVSVVVHEILADYFPKLADFIVPQLRRKLSRQH
jgi:PST family polysaccharide transporter